MPDCSICGRLAPVARRVDDVGLVCPEVVGRDDGNDGGHRLMNSKNYRYRWYCSPCHEGGDWYKTYEESKEAESEHIESHDEPLYEPTRIQRYPAEEVLRN